jgi:hypothetical protein
LDQTHTLLRDAGDDTGGGVRPAALCSQALTIRAKTDTP